MLSDDFSKILEDAGSKFSVRRYVLPLELDKKVLAIHLFHWTGDANVSIILHAAWGWESGHSGGHKCLCSATERWHRGLHTWATVTNRFVVQYIGYTRWKEYFQAQFKTYVQVSTVVQKGRETANPVLTNTFLQRSRTVSTFAFPSSTHSALISTMHCAKWHHHHF